MQYAYRKYRVPVCLTADQKSEIRRLTDGQRYAYNWAASKLKDGRFKPGDKYKLSNCFTPLRHATDWLKTVPRAMQNIAIQDACTAAKASAARGRGDTKYRSKRRQVSLKCALAPVVVGQYGIKLPRFGTVRANIPNEVMEHEPRSYEFIPRKGSYLLYVSCRVSIPRWNAPVVHTIKGVDRGTVEPTVVVTMKPDGTVVSKDSYNTASPFRNDRVAYQRLQSKMSKMNRHSNRFRRLHICLRKRFQKTANRRTYAECVAAKHVCEDHNPSTIILEDLKLDKMTRNGGSHKSGMNREMRFVRHYSIEQRIRNRAELSGIEIRMLAPHYTSQTCARCSHIDKASRITRDMFQCTKCHYTQQADVNAATIIGRLGLPPSDDDDRERPPTEVGTPFVRRELDARLNCFTAVGGPLGHENQVSARSLVHRGMEKQRRSPSVPSGSF